MFLEDRNSFVEIYYQILQTLHMDTYGYPRWYADYLISEEQIRMHIPKSAKIIETNLRYYWC
jgi:hypothetical protein